MRNHIVLFASTGIPELADNDHCRSECKRDRINACDPRNYMFTWSKCTPN